MPIGKEIHKQFSKRAGDRRDRVNKLAEERVRAGLGPIEPPTVEQYKKNIVARAKSSSLHITELANSGPRRVSPNEGMPAINWKSGAEIVKKAVTKVRPKTRPGDPTAGAIKPTDTKKSKKSSSRKKPARRCSNCSQPGHTKRSCPSDS